MTDEHVIRPYPGTVGDLADFAYAYPAGSEADSMRRRGRKDNYPRCCIEFYVAIIPLVWSRVPEAEAYWAAQQGYVRCPTCFGVPLSTPLP